jgi:predicted DNA-binding transcriptional regulator AlpA
MAILTKTQKLLTLPELAQELNVKPSWIRSQVFKGTIPLLRLSSRTIRFDTVQIREWLEKNKQDQEKWRNL